MKKNQRTMTKDEFSKVLTKFSGCVEEAVKEVFVPAFQWSMEQSLSSRRSSEIISSSPYGVERGVTLASPSERSSPSQRPDSEISSCSSSIGSACSLSLMATSPFRSSKKSWLDETSKTLEDLKHGLKCLTMVGLSEVSPAPLNQSVVSVPELLERNVQRTAEVASDVVDHVVESVSAALFITSGCTTINLKGNSVSGHEAGLNNEENGKKRTSKKTLKFPKIKFPKVKMPKLRFKKWRNRIEPGTVVSQDCTQERPVPTVDGPSNSASTSTSTAIPVPARKTLFSRVVKAVSKLLGAAPNAAITFSTSLFDGSATDTDMVLKSGILKRFKQGDQILADKGFLIQDILSLGVTVNITLFLHHGKFTISEVQSTKESPE
ncbi:hypothetical protein MHYP_G00173850 [Metynnis hypsauchen]